MGMGGLEGVAIGSTEPPRFVHLSYKAPARDGPVAIVGKGITFDSGGLCLKPADGMLNMKDDMSGAGAVIGIFSALAELKPRVNVHGIFAATENMPGGSAYKTRDVLAAMNGKTMEIINTDAEGRLILADALSYASRLKPSEIIDMATLTGACVGGARPRHVGDLHREREAPEGHPAAAKAQGEKVWPLPLENDYMDMIKSDVADMKNSGGRWRRDHRRALPPRSSSRRASPWAHLDIAARRSSRTTGPTGPPAEPESWCERCCATIEEALREGQAFFGRELLEEGQVAAAARRRARTPFGASRALRADRAARSSASSISFASFSSHWRERAEQEAFSPSRM
jgi:leucyl aminopeptidase